jgi:hypothetical protein
MFNIIWWITWQKKRILHDANYYRGCNKNQMRCDIMASYNIRCKEPALSLHRHVDPAQLPTIRFILKTHIYLSISLLLDVKIMLHAHACYKHLHKTWTFSFNFSHKNRYCNFWKFSVKLLGLYQCIDILIRTGI